MIRDITARVTRNVDLGGGNYLLEFPVPADVRDTMEPAQFFMIGVPDSDVLLRRPFSVCGLPGTFDDGADDAAQVLYKVYGRGTALLASLAPGAEVTVLGPLGEGFTPPDDPEATPVLVAGGIGSAPFPLWIDRLRAGSPRRPKMFYGGRGAADLPLDAWFRDHADLETATEDGSSGTTGRVTAPLERWLDAHRGDPMTLYACGPDPMLRAIRRIALERGLACQLALEAHMACGFGVCIGCVVPVHDGDGGIEYRRVCVDGPVMAAESLAW